MDHSRNFRSFRISKKMTGKKKLVMNMFFTIQHMDHWTFLFPFSIRFPSMFSHLRWWISDEDPFFSLRFQLWGSPGGLDPSLLAVQKKVIFNYQSFCFLNGDTTSIIRCGWHNEWRYVGISWNFSPSNMMISWRLMGYHLGITENPLLNGGL